jgi:hypothetical protein
MPSIEIQFSTLQIKQKEDQPLWVIFVSIYIKVVNELFHFKFIMLSLNYSFL